MINIFVLILLDSLISLRLMTCFRCPPGTLSTARRGWSPARRTPPRRAGCTITRTLRPKARSGWSRSSPSTNSSSPTTCWTTTATWVRRPEVMNARGIGDGGWNKRRGCVNNGVCYEIMRLFDRRQRVNHADLQRFWIFYFRAWRKKRAFLSQRSLIGWIWRRIIVDILGFSGLKIPSSSHNISNVRK